MGTGEADEARIFQVRQFLIFTSLTYHATARNANFFREKTAIPLFSRMKNLTFAAVAFFDATVYISSDAVGS